MSIAAHATRISSHHHRHRARAVSCFAIGVQKSTAAFTHMRYVDGTSRLVARNARQSSLKGT